MRHTEPSRVSPLLGIKVLMMGLFVRAFLHTSLSPRQWIALALCTAGALALGFSGTRLRPRAVTFILLAAAGYVASDLFISRLVRLVADSGQPLSSAALFALGITYSGLALTSLIGAPFLGGMRELTRHTRDVAPFAALWLLAMAFYYMTLGLVGPVFGVVLQSTRGLFSVMIGGLLQRFGHRGHLEVHLSRGTFLCRILSAILMFGAIVLYALA
jgi:drug/metabolite transporter (DMT)-like permease